MSVLIKSNPNGFLLGGLLDDFFGRDSFYNHRPANEPLVNIKETDEAFELELAVPGLKKEEISVDQKDNLLTVSFEKKEEEQKEESKYLKREFSTQSFKRSFSLPLRKVNVEQLSAAFQNGILTVNLPKKETVEVRKKIEVK